MIQAINGILFYFTSLFAVNTIFISEQTHLTIDIDNKTVKIDYIDLMTPRIAIDRAENGLSKINKATEFSNRFRQLKMTSTKIYEKDKKLNAIINFSYDNQQELFKLLEFDTDSAGNSFYQILMHEKMFYCNGQVIKGGDRDKVIWNKDIRIIELELRHGKLGDKDFDNKVSLLTYWKK